MIDERSGVMADANKFSEGLIDMAERFADVVDSAQGRGGRKSGNGLRWLLLPAAGAGAYALATSSSKIARNTRGLLERARDRAADLPDTELLSRVREATGVSQETASSTPSGSRRTTRSNGRKTQASRRRRTTTSRR
ncbi:MAG TPA: hypothetical protein VHH55_05180 [Gaiellaceae bacterium]|nr:hypothetical protein [Gaiellaceae bacterium]